MTPKFQLSPTLSRAWHADPPAGALLPRAREATDARDCGRRGAESGGLWPHGSRGRQLFRAPEPSCPLGAVMTSPYPRAVIPLALALVVVDAEERPGTAKGPVQQREEETA